MTKDLSHLTEEEQIELVREDGTNVQFIKNPAHKVQQMALEQDLMNFILIDNPTAIAIDTIKIAMQMKIHKLTKEDTDKLYAKIDEVTKK